MSSKQKKSKSASIGENSKSGSDVKDYECPKKEGDACLAPGFYSDSDPVGGG